MKENKIDYRLEQYLKVLDENIKDLVTPSGLPIGKVNAIVVSALRTIKQDIEEILKGGTVERGE